MVMPDFNAKSLPVAIKSLFELNGYEVKGPVLKYGGEVDLVAVKTGDPFAEPIYIEATIATVDNDKYAKDNTKLSAIHAQEPQSKLLIVSSAGFTLNVREKAKAARIDTKTYDELFAQFQSFGPYITQVLHDGPQAEGLQRLASLYEEPVFDDIHGRQPATQFLTKWRRSDSARKWLIVTGEYGTGKTALTQVLLYRWLKEYELDASRPLPFRIELRSFTRQFDAESLLHRFLDRQGLKHLSIDFVFSLIRSGRIVLLLDGYDEMAQYMHARERRVCLEALAQLSAEGARGILTSRPNYFTEAEELNVLEALYTSLERAGVLTGDEQEILAEEREVDALFETHLINRFERKLRDLTPDQTIALVGRYLSGDLEAQKVVLGILTRVFRASDEGSSLALSGKPVIVTYLLEVAETLKDGKDYSGTLSEWQIYDLIVRKLMARDHRASPEVFPDRRRAFLRKLALRLAHRDEAVITDENFTEFVAAEFDTELRKRGSARDEYLQQLVTDLRRSATLTRDVSGGTSGSRFSHNSLREFLVTELLHLNLAHGDLKHFPIPITDAMRLFAAARGPSARAASIHSLAAAWPTRARDDGAGQALALLWTALVEPCESVRAALEQIVGQGLDLARVMLDNVQFGDPLEESDLTGSRWTQATLEQIGFTNVSLIEADFTDALLSEVDFTAAKLMDATFTRAVLVEVNVTGADLTGADFTAVGELDSIVSNGRRFSGDAAVGLLQVLGAHVRSVNAIHRLRHDPQFAVVNKVARKLMSGPATQVRGLTQRGGANANPALAARFVALLISDGLVDYAGSKTVVQVTEEGRRQLGPMVDGVSMSERLQVLWSRAVR